LKLATSNYRTLLKLEAIGQSHDVRLHEVKDIIVNEHKAVEKKKQEVNELKAIFAEQNVQSKHQEESVSSKLKKATTELKDAQRKCHPGFLIAFDNIDFHMKRRSMTMTSQNRDIHWVNHVMIENRVSGNHLSSEEPKADIHDIPNIVFLPSVVDERQQRLNYVVLVSRILSDYFDAFAEFKDVCVKHIPHKYSKEMSEKSDKVSSK
jgi:hypothetical protein